MNYPKLFVLLSITIFAAMNAFAEDKTWSLTFTGVGGYGTIHTLGEAIHKGSLAEKIEQELSGRNTMVKFYDDRIADAEATLERIKQGTFPKDSAFVAKVNAEKNIRQLKINRAENLEKLNNAKATRAALNKSVGSWLKVRLPISLAFTGGGAYFLFKDDSKKKISNVANAVDAEPRAQELYATGSPDVLPIPVQ